MIVYDTHQQCPDVYYRTEYYVFNSYLYAVQTLIHPPGTHVELINLSY
jgi:hypothetical protein